MKSCLWFATATVALASSAWGGYFLETSSNGQHSIAVLPGQEFTVDIVLRRDLSDAQTNEAIDACSFLVEVSQPGVKYVSYQWSSPFITGGTDDFSEPNQGSASFPMEITPASDNGWGLSPGALDVYLANFNPGVETFDEGVLVTMRLQAPATGGAFTVRAYPDGEYSFTGPADGWTVYPTVQGQQLQIAVPEPSICMLAGVVVLSSLSLRRRAAVCKAEHAATTA